MALPSPTSLVSIGASVTLTDILGSPQTFNRIVPTVNFKALNVQYQGNVALPTGTSISFTPVTPVTSFAVAYVRNLGGTGSGNVDLQWTPAGGAQVITLNLDVGAIFLYASPLLSPVAISGITPGIASLIVQAGAATSSNIEVLMAG